MNKIEIYNWVINGLIFSLPFSWYFIFQIYKESKKLRDIIKIQDSIIKGKNEIEIKFFYSDGLAGRDYYMTLNDVRIEICLNNGDDFVALHKAKLTLSKLKIEYNQPIEFTHDGLM